MKFTPLRIVTLVALICIVLIGLAFLVPVTGPKSLYVAVDSRNLDEKSIRVNGEYFDSTVPYIVRDNKLYLKWQTVRFTPLWVLVFPGTYWEKDVTALLDKHPDLKPLCPDPGSIKWLLRK